MIKFDRLEKLDKDHKENRNALIFVSITLVSFIATLIVSIIFSEIAMIVVLGVGVGFLTAALMGFIISFKESRKAYLEEETRVLEELHRETSKMLFNAMVEISNDIAKRKAEQEKAKAEAEKPKAKKKVEPKAKAETKTTKKKN